MLQWNESNVCENKTTEVLFPTLRVGYVALNDAIPFILAKELGIFRRYGLDVKLTREIGWATIREKIEFNELDAAQALAPIPFAAAMGLNNRHPMECLVSLILNLNGDTIALSRNLGDELTEQLERIKKGDFSHRSFGKPTFAVVSEYSSHHFLLRKWLKKNNIDPDKDIHMVILPPGQMPSVLRNDYIDGFCAGEPWGSKSVANGSAILAASSLDVDPGHVEKVLMVSHSFAVKRSDSHIRLIAALIEACEYADKMEQRSDYASLISQSNYLNCEEDVIRVGLEGRISTQETSQLGILSSQFLRFDENRPTSKHSKWILKNMSEAGLLKDVTVDPLTISKIVFAEEYFESALKLKKQFQCVPTV